jgi:hypothetical protein
MKTVNSLSGQIELWLLLVLLISIGWPFGLILTSLIFGAFRVALGSISSLVIAGISGGILISLLSLYVLRDSIRGTGIWVLATITGWVLGLLGTFYSIKSMSGGTAWIVGGALGGLIYGLIQSAGLKNKSGKSFLRIILNAIGWASAYGIGYAIPSTLSLDNIPLLSEAITRGMLGWVMLGIFAVLLLILLFSTLKRGDRSEKRVQWWP